MKRSTTKLALLLSLVQGAGVATLAVAPGCAFLNGNTKTAKGELYTSGDQRFDPYFEAVHREQTAAASWKDEQKSSRRPILNALNLPAEASNRAILSGVKEKKGDAALAGAVTATTHGERERAKRMAAHADRLVEMKKHGEELRKQAAEDRKNLAADKADEKKTAKKDEIKRELTAAVDAVDSLESDARDEAKSALDLASKLRPAWDGKEEPAAAPPPPPEEKKEEKKEEPKEEKKAPPKKAPPAKAAPKPSPAPEGDEKPEKPVKPSKPPDEVFNP